MKEWFASLVTLILWWRTETRRTSSYKVEKFAGVFVLFYRWLWCVDLHSYKGAMMFTSLLCNFLVASYELTSGITLIINSLIPRQGGNFWFLKLPRSVPCV